MRNRYFLLLTAFLLGITITLTAQNPAIKWRKYIWPSTATATKISMISYDAKPVSSGGFIVAGSDSVDNIYSNFTVLYNKTVTGLAGLYRFDADGNPMWSKLERNYLRSTYSAVEETGDGAFVAAGHYTSTTAPQTAEFFISKYSSAGNVLWNKTLGGTGHDIAYGLSRLPGSGYLVAGMTASNNGSVSGNHNAATSDAWLVKLDESGNLTWQKCFGGTGSDSAFAVIPTADSGFIVAGSSTVANGDIPGNNGQADGWIFKINKLGNLVWSKNYGGAQHDVFKSIVASVDGTFMLTGYTRSAGNNMQVWVMQIDANGNLVQERFFGGSEDDLGVSISRAKNNQFLISGGTGSGDGDVDEHYSQRDAWYVLYDANAGNIVWNKVVGNIHEDFGTAAFLMPDNEYVTIGYGGPEMSPSYSHESYLHISKLGDGNAITGIFYLDNNNNGIRDTGEPDFNQAGVAVMKPGFDKFAGLYNGMFTVQVELGTYTITPQLHNPYYTITPASQTSTFTTYLNKDTVSFAVRTMANKSDLIAGFHALNQVRPGFTGTYRGYYLNVGTSTINNGQYVLKTDSRLAFISSIPAVSEISGDTLKWNLPTLNPLDEGFISMELMVLPPPSTNNGDTLYSFARISPYLMDETPNNNTDIRRQIVTGSYDPNDKMEANAGAITPKQVTDGDYLNYLIRFQNTGTDTAFTVNVQDTLDSKLNLNSFEVITASHAYNVQVTDGDKVSWTFNNIKLPDSNINEPASHGYIAYRVKPKSTVALGDTIHSTSHIYFDFNLPVATNNAFTVVVLPSAALPVNLSSFTAKLNGSIVNVNWKTATESKVKHFEIQRSGNGAQYNTIGIVKAKNIANGSSYSFNDNNPLNGYNYYRLKMVDIDESAELSSIVIINNSNETNIVTAVYPNPTTGKVLLRLQGQLNDNVRVQVLDHFGREMMSKVYGRQSGNQLQVPLELGKLSKGNYILRIYVGEKVYLHKLLIQYN